MPLASPPHDLYLLVEGVELAVPRLDVEVEAVPEVRPPRQRRHAAAHAAHWHGVQIFLHPLKYILGELTDDLAARDIFNRSVKSRLCKSGETDEQQRVLED